VLVDKGYWGGLVEWIQNTLAPGGYIDGEDTTIFRLVDTAEEAVQAIVDGIHKPWYSPEHAEHARPMAPDETGEGTREGEPIRQAREDVAPPAQKPQQ
jgi:hypothetical protein